VVECLLCKCKAPSSNPSHQKKKKKSENSVVRIQVKHIPTKDIENKKEPHLTKKLLGQWVWSSGSYMKYEMWSERWARGMGFFFF
jgi:hypothetical protein